jgi:glycerol kinase
LFLRSFIKSVKELFRSAKIDIDESTNLKINLTTSRKTYIYWALENGENIYDIARNCGNSVEVIQKSYANKLSNIALKID